MSPIKIFIYCLLFIVNCINIKAENFQHVGLENGLSQPSVISISQDGLGRMWFGTQEGINIYDGTHIHSYKGMATNSDNSQIWLGNYVTFIKSDIHGNIYFISDLNLYYYDILTENFKQITQEGTTSSLSIYKNQIFFTQKNRLYTYSPENKSIKFINELPEKVEINALEIDKNNIYFSTISGIFIYNLNQKKFKHLLCGENIYRIFITQNDEIWVGTKNNGLYRIIRNNIIKVNYSKDGSNGIINSQIREFAEDNNNNIWFGTFLGLQKFDTKNQTYSTVKIPQYAGGLNHSSIYALFKDKQGNIWTGSYFGGVDYFNPTHGSIMHYDYQPGGNPDLYYSYINGIIMDKRLNLWISTDGGGLSCVDKNWKTIESFAANPKNSIPHNNIKSLCYDEKNDILYIGTYLGGLSKYDIKNKTFFNYLYEYKKEIAPSNIIYHLKKWDNNIIIASTKGMFSLDIQNNIFSQLPGLCTFFDIDPNGNLYYCSKKQLIIVNLHNHQEKQIKLPTQSTISQILATNNGVYICTLGEGLYFYNKETQSTTSHTIKNSNIISDYCYNIKQISSTQFILTSDKGVMLFDPNNKGFTSLNSKDLKAPIINGCDILIAPDKSIYIGDTKGITHIKDLKFKNYTLSDDLLFFSRLYINNSPIYPKKNGILTQSIAYTDALNLNSRQNNIQVELAYPDYLNNHLKLFFEYKLEGFEDTWNQSTTPLIRYTNLKPGKYILHAKVANNIHTNPKGIKIAINILPPWYNTWEAWLLYIAILFTTTYIFMRNKIAQKKLAVSLERERFEKQQIEKLNHEKLVFFTNISHEFRTPLTLIIGHVDALLQSLQLSPIIYNKIIKVKQNAQHMDNLVSELLDFRRFSQNSYLLKISAQDICSFIKEIYYTFSDLANQKKLQYEFNANPEKIICWFDAKQLEKVFFNLLSNAFKYTQSGSISIKISILNQSIYISIEDTGEGISQADSLHIFDRFYQAKNTNNPIISTGTGIGLALTKNIIEKHHGQIMLKSELGKGSEFTIILPLDHSEYINDEHIQFISDSIEVQINDQKQISMLKESLLDSDTLSTNYEYLHSENNDIKYSLLIVEDNEELLQVLNELFSPFYVTIRATNGKEGLEKAFKYRPDIIISDIMMPEMSGTEMCLQIKSNIDLCHIPVILLTALNSIDQNIEGLNRGADDYISKPFNSKLLLAKVNNILRNRLLIQHQINKQPISEIDLTSINPLDRDILKKASAAIEAHIDDPEFDIPELCKEIGIGRSLLYSKFKSLTGMTPNNFILNQRLQYAASLLKKYPTMPIAEISDRCGFNSPVYFSKCFKNQYGTTPQNYKKQEKLEL